MMPLFSREKSSLKGRWRLETVQGMRSSSSNPVSCSENSIKIYGSKEEILARKSPETVDAPGFAPDASIPVTLYEESGRFSFCPVFDNGLALLADTQVDYPLDGEIYQMIARVKGKPFKADFLEQMEAAEALCGAQLHFTFSKGDVETALSKVQPYYGDSICQRIQSVIFEQMRKYQIFF